MPLNYSVHFDHIFQCENIVDARKEQCYNIGIASPEMSYSGSNMVIASYQAALIFPLLLQNLVEINIIRDGCSAQKYSFCP